MMKQTGRLIRCVAVSTAVLTLLPALTVCAQRLPITAYTTAHGLAHDTVNRVVTDSRGFTWFCTADGLSRYDGYAFVNFGSDEGLPSGPANDLLEMANGEYWVATDGGLVRFDPQGVPDRLATTGSQAAGSRPMFTLIGPVDPDGRARAVTVLREGRDGTLWVGTRNGLYRLEYVDGHRELRSVDLSLRGNVPDPLEIIDVLEDSRHSLWIATGTGLYRRWPDGTGASYGKQAGIPASELSDLFEDRAGHLWVATRNGLFRMNIEGSHDPPSVLHALNVAEGLPNRWVTQVFETSDGRFWVGTGDGLAELLSSALEDGRRFRSYTTRNGLSHRFVSTFAEDRAGNLWIGTPNAGAMRMARDGFTSYGTEDGIDSVAAIFEDRSGTLCFRGGVPGDARSSVFEGATLNLLDRQPRFVHLRVGSFDGSRFRWFYPHAVPDPGWQTQGVTLQARNGDWWLGSGQGLFRFSATDRFGDLAAAHPISIYTTRNGLAANQVFRLFEDSRGDVWISTVAADTNGLARWDARTQQLRDVASSPGLPSIREELPLSFGEDADGHVWIGFRGRVARYSDGRFSLFTAREGVPPGAITSIYLDRVHQLWLASAQSGLVRVDRSETERPSFVSYTTKNGLTSNDIEAILEDDDGHLYIGGGNGLDRLDPATGRVRHFTAAFGLMPGLLRTAYRDRDGVLWFGFTTGLARFAPGPASPVAPPDVLITGMQVSGVPRFVSAVGEHELSIPDLPARDNQLQVEFVAIAFDAGEVLRYQYQLKGADADFGPVTTQRTVTYANLAPGRYTFLVRAVNSDGLVSERPASISVRILPPLWLRWWSLALVALFTGMAIYAVHRYRVGRVVELANIRRRIATDLHDDIGANLTRMVLLSEVLQRTGAAGRDAGQRPTNGTETADGPLVSIARIGRESLSAMSDIVWAITPARDSLLDLTRRMRGHAEDVFTLRDIELRFDASEAGEYRRLGGDVRRDLLLIFKEAVNNAARHSQCSRVEVTLRVEGSRLILAVADDGLGFDPSAESQGLGLASLRRRAQRLNGTLEIVTSKGAGTTVRVTAPL